MPKADFKAYQQPKKIDKLPSMIEVITATYGPYLNSTQAAKCLNLGRTRMYELLKAGAIKAKRMGSDNGTIRISVIDLVRFMTPEG